MKTVIDSGSELFGDAYRKVDSVVGGAGRAAWKSMKSTAKNVSEGVSNAVHGVYTKTKNGVKGIANGVSEVGESIWGLGAAGVKKAERTVQKGAGKVFNAMDRSLDASHTEEADGASSSHGGHSSSHRCPDPPQPVKHKNSK